MNLPNKGFSLIELLVVIAIIAILAGIAFPVFARAKDSAYRSADMSKMNELRTALALYRNDQGAYPPALLGYATAYLSDGTTSDDPADLTTSNIVPADALVSGLYPKRVPSLPSFQPSYLRAHSANFNSATNSAVWPYGADTDGQAGVDHQRYGPDTTVDRCIYSRNAVVKRLFYTVSGFDSASVPDGAGDMRNEMRYTLFWTGWTVPANPCAPVTGGPGVGETGSGTDNPRQLGYADPPDTTVITWDSFFRNYDSTQSLTRGSKDTVVFLGGAAKPMDSQIVAGAGYAVKP
jgi:prepilin-type N-terminal cleavage/methylation domain-containing protein